MYSTFLPMGTRLYTITRNTFVHTIRQPIYSVIIVISLLLFMLAPSISLYTLDEDVKLLRELGLSTLFLAGLFIAIFSATGAVTEEIETGTITTVLSKPVPRPVFVLGKFGGVAAAVCLAHYINTVAFVLAVRHGVLTTASDYPDWPVITAAASVVFLAILASALLNYFYDWNFPASAVLLGALFAAFAVVLLLFVDRDWNITPSALETFSLFDLYASLLLLFGIFIIIALAVLFSARFNVVMTLTCCVSVFLFGLISDWVFGRLAGHPWLAKIGSALIPNMQVFWVSDAIYETGKIPPIYLAMGLSYAACYTLGILALSVALFQRRQVG